MAICDSNVVFKIKMKWLIQSFAVELYPVAAVYYVGGGGDTCHFLFSAAQMIVCLAS